MSVSSFSCPGPTKTRAISTCPSTFGAFFHSLPDRVTLTKLQLWQSQRAHLERKLRDYQVINYDVINYAVIISIVALLIVPVMLILTGVVQRIATPAFDKLQQELGTLSGFQEATISGHKVIISNRRQGWADEKNEEQAVNVYDVGSRAFFHRSFSTR